MAEPKSLESENQITRTLIALADEQRRRILALVKDRELKPIEISDLMGEDCRSLSYHLRILRDSELVSVRPEGRVHHYRLNHQAICRFGLNGLIDQKEEGPR